jgi:hypothetical protein
VRIEFSQYEWTNGSKCRSTMCFFLSDGSHVRGCTPTNRLRVRDSVECRTFVNFLGPAPHLPLDYLNCSFRETLISWRGDSPVLHFFYFFHKSLDRFTDLIVLIPL